MSNKDKASIMLIIGFFIASAPLGMISLYILRNEKAPVHKTVAITWILLALIHVLSNI